MKSYNEMTITELQKLLDFFQSTSYGYPLITKKIRKELDKRHNENIKLS